MNKKFSTLVASALLATAFSASAQTAGTLQVKAIADKIETGTPTRYYVLNTTTVAAGAFADATNEALIMNADGSVGTKGATLADINNQLWTIKVTTVAGSNRFVLTNAGTSATLSFDPKFAVAANATGVVTVPATTDLAYLLTGANTEWTWVSAPNAPLTAELQVVKELTSAFRTDSTMALAVETATKKVFAYKYANDKKPATIAGATLISAQALIPGTKTMAETDLNVLGSAATATYFTLNSGKTDLVGDIFTGKKFHATDASTGTVNLNLIGSDEKVTGRFAYVDTAFHTATGLNENKLYKLAINEKKDGIANLAAGAMEFIIVRDLFKDSLVVSVDPAKALKKYNATAGANNSNWQDAIPNTGDVRYSYTVVSAIKLTPETEVFTLFEADGTTVGAKNTNLTFGANSAASDNVLTSVEDGLYYIMNSKGQYMASVIHENGTAADWATVKAGEQNVDHMPAFQWVMLKANNYSDQAKAVSPMIGTNREFANAVIPGSPFQLKQNPGATYMYTDGHSDSLKLVQITNDDILGDTLLGYKNLTSNELLVETYTFNYFNPYVSDKFIAKSATDSVLNVLDGKTPFSLEAGQNEKYGYTVENANGRIAGLKQLYRTNYKMYVPSVKGKMYVSRAKEDKFALSSNFDVAKVDSFFFKENNQIGEKCYHAMVKANATGLDGFKAGVADNDLDAVLKQQVIEETRTSSFNIAPFDSPLYRRFNSELEGVAGDATDTLRFVEKYRGEYLQIENNPNFVEKGIDYLGIYTADKAKSGLSFIVDTAWLDRGNGKIKPQYLISIERDDLKAAAGEKCPVCAELEAAGKPVPTDCPHDGKARLGFNRGKYLVNFQDSISDASDSYVWKGYTRAGFVDAVNMGDSLFILVNDFKGMKNADVDTAKIVAAYTKAKINEDYIIDLTGDKHKYATWSMRYVDPTKTATDKTFLMESMKSTVKNGGTDDLDIAPLKAAWLKMQNGCLVLSDPKTSSFDIFTQGDDALIFDVKHVADDELATDNEDINAATVVSVVAGEGQVVIKNAEDKTVAISNILGQTLVNTVLTSDNATISVPAGIVVVAVEGEAAVKVVVR